MKRFYTRHYQQRPEVDEAGVLADLPTALKNEVCVMLPSCSAHAVAADSLNSVRKVALFLVTDLVLGNPLFRDIAPIVVRAMRCLFARETLALRFCALRPLFS